MLLSECPDFLVCVVISGCVLSSVCVRTAGCVVCACAHQCVYVCVTEGNGLCADWMWAVYAFAGVCASASGTSTDRPISDSTSQHRPTIRFFLFVVSVVFSLFW